MDCIVDASVYLFKMVNTHCGGGNPVLPPANPQIQQNQQVLQNQPVDLPAVGVEVVEGAGAVEGVGAVAEDVGVVNLGTSSLTCSCSHLRTHLWTHLRTHL